MFKFWNFSFLGFVLEMFNKLQLELILCQCSKGYRFHLKQFNVSKMSMSWMQQIVLGDALQLN
jgi:hypothetical protein